MFVVARWALGFHLVPCAARIEGVEEMKVRIETQTRHGYPVLVAIGVTPDGGDIAIRDASPGDPVTIADVDASLRAAGLPETPEGSTAILGE
jgi:hypothetical protein